MHWLQRGRDDPSLRLLQDADTGTIATQHTTHTTSVQMRRSVDGGDGAGRAAMVAYRECDGMNPFKFTKAILWALWTPHYRRALKKAFHDNLEMDRIATDCAIMMPKGEGSLAWTKQLKERALQSGDPILWLKAARRVIQLGDVPTNVQIDRMWKWMRKTDDELS